MDYAVAFAVKVVESALVKEPAKPHPFQNLQAVESRSLLGKHNGLIDDDLLDQLVREHEAA
jgi:hypothetical protein